MDLKGPYQVGPLSSDPTEALAQVLAVRWTDPTFPENKLKRPVWRICVHCEGRYCSKVSVLCDDGFCSEACKRATEALMQQFKECL